MWYGGIDVGKKGGAVVIDDKSNILFKHHIQDYEKFCAFITSLHATENEIVWVIEDVHSLFGMSAKSNFNFGHIKGFKEGVLMAFNFDYVLVSPKVWQRGLWISKDTVLMEEKGVKLQKRDTKATSLNAARRIFPDESFLATKRSKVPHDGLVDAALMAEYCRIINNLEWNKENWTS